MDWKPRNRPVFRMPGVSESATNSAANKAVFKQDSPLVVVNAADFTKTGEGGVGKLHSIKGLGISGASITMLPFTSPSISDENAAQALFAEYEIKLPGGQRTVEVICTPTERIHEGRGLRYAISFDNGPATIVNVHSAAGTPAWEKNVLRGYTVGKSTHNLDKAGLVKIRLSLMDPGLLVSQIRVY